MNNVDQQSQYVKLFKDYGLNAVVLESTIDNNFISFIEYKEMGTKFNRIDSDLSDVLKDKDSEENKEENEKITDLFKSVINDRVEKYSVESLLMLYIFHQYLYIRYNLLLCHRNLHLLNNQI